MTVSHSLTNQIPDIIIDENVYTIGAYHYNWHKELELFWLLNGEVEINVDGKIESMQEDGLYLINSNVGHATFATDSNTIALRLHIDPSFFIQQGIDITNGRFELNTVHVDDEEKVKDLRYFLACLHKQIELEPHNTFKINALFYRITSILIQFFNYDVNKDINETSYKETSEVIKNVINYIENNYKEDISLDILSKKFNYTSAYLSTIIKDELGINYYEYLTRCRLRHAVTELTQEGKVGDIALRSGFSDVRAFNLMFKSHFGLTPTQYRDKLIKTGQVDHNHFKKAFTNYQNDVYKTKIEDIIKKYSKS